ncbi:hypothetical protein AYO21_07103 [Fonsecaea monophora]|uniref:Cytochrome P450 n=1 Tax=Fonsecaea monophora TaxID=254056 RepID=A0A177F586_9EURO|nr:hypothetical protein AYO21_07103 [Fonsecaea monophora]OAG38750.1 hypothetical protein AYO21_07103 [Fonsecaea monophora]
MSPASSSRIMAVSTGDISTIQYVVVVVGLFILYKILHIGMRPKNYPPGPPTIPIVGNLLQIPIKNFHLGFQEIAQKYGPIVSLKLGATDMIMLNHPTVVRELLEKRSNIYSARPDIYIREYLDNYNILLRESEDSNDDMWRRQRKLYHARLNVKTTDTYLPYQHFESVQFLHDLLYQPEEFLEHTRRFTASVSTTLIYGWRTPKIHDGWVKRLLEWFDATSDAINFQLVDFYPFLKPWYRIMPHWMSSYKRTLRRIRQLENATFLPLLEEAKRRIQEGKHYPCFTADMLLDKDADRLEDVQIAHNAGNGFGAAMDTTSNTLMGFIKAMALYPEVQAKGQKEIDSVIGADKMPSWDDRARLPYIRAIVEETVRWAPSPLTAAAPHSLLKDDVYNGMVIPKQPRQFRPERFTDESTALESTAISPDSSKRPHFTFGGGRRVCPGFHVAERALFIAISRMLWSFDIRRKYDSNGNPTPIEPDAVTPGFIVRPADFECDIKPRDGHRKDMIINAWRECEQELDSEGNYTEEFFRRTFKKKF